MNEIEIRLHCVEAAEGDLYRAKQIYAWVTGRDEPVVGGVVTPYPISGSASDCAQGGPAFKAGGITPISS